MKSRLVFFTALVVVSIFTIFSYSSCKKTETSVGIDPCASVACQNNGVCYSGSCSCPLGYSGDVCENQNNKPYLGKWNVEQTVASSNDQQTIGKKSNYTIEIKEVQGSAVKLTMDNLLGNADVKGVKITIHQKIGTTTVDSNEVEADVISVASDFIFGRYQPLSGTIKQIVKGEGSINGNASVISGYFYLTSPHQTLGVLNERIDFTAYYAE